MIRPSLLSVICRITDMWTLYFTNQGFIRIEVEGSQEEYKVIETDLTHDKGWIFSSIAVLQGQNALHTLKGLTKGQAEQVIARFKSLKSELLTKQRIETEKKQLAKDFDSLKEYLSTLKDNIPRDVYFSARRRQKALKIITPYIKDIKDCLRRARLEYFKETELAEKIQSALGVIVSFYDNPRHYAEEINRIYVENEKYKWRELFNNIEDYELSEEQKTAAVTFEDNTLLNAAAGSGKTSTVVARVLYMLVKGVPPEEIVCLAFNRGAKDEIAARVKLKVKKLLKTKPGDVLDEKIHAHLATINPSNVHCKTFHGLGKSIVEAYRGKPYTRHAVSKKHQSESRFKRALDACLEKPLFQSDWIWLQTVLRFPEDAPPEFKSEFEYNQYLQSIYEKKQQNEGVLSLGTSKLVKSSQEVALSNWLYLNGVAFDYERPFKEGSEVLGCSESEPWLPDFTYKLDDGTIIVHEHFGLDANGKAPSFFDKPQLYEDNAKKKKAALIELSPLHFWTSSAQFYDGSIFDVLKEELLSRGISLSERSYEVVQDRLEDIGQRPNFEIIASAVTQIRANGWKSHNLSNRLAAQPNQDRAKRFLNVCFSLAEKIDLLLENDKQIDYDAMISRAINYLDQGEEPAQALPPYRYFIIDELQDTAPGRATLIQHLMKQQHFTRLFVVGDDWQSINRFAGSDLSYFTDFGEHFKYPFENSDKSLYLTETRRCPKGINDVARDFITSTGHLDDKAVVSKGDQTTKGVINVLTIEKDNDLPDIITSTLTSWRDEHCRKIKEEASDSTPKKPTVMILGRYSAQYIKGLSEEGYIETLEKYWLEHFDFIGDVNKETGRKNIYHTVHRSKGLEADYILIVGLYSVLKTAYSFPSERWSDPLLKLVSPSSEPVADAEERRLFYVGLTRAKKQVALCADNYAPSNYVSILLRHNRGGHVLFNGRSELPELCHKCDKGVFYRRFPGKKGRSDYYRCSNISGCKAMKSIKR